MKIGLISDTHDNLPLIKRAVEFFNERKVELVLHAGDFVAPFSLKPLKELQSPWRGVFGNNDGERKGLLKVSEGKIEEGPLFLELDSKKIALIHEFQELPAEVIVFGHTHLPQVERRENILIVNPGEACGWLSGKPTVAILDTLSLSVDIFPL